MELNLRQVNTLVPAMLVTCMSSSSNSGQFTSNAVPANKIYLSKQWKMGGTPATHGGDPDGVPGS